MSEPTPLILCGKTSAIAATVCGSLRPEYEVIHVILSPAQGNAELPGLLRGEAPPDGENVGTKNYSTPAAAVITGAGYDDAAIDEMRKTAKGNVPWLRPDLSKPTPPLGPGYGEALVERVKVCLKDLAESGKLNGDGVFFY